MTEVTAVRPHALRDPCSACGSELGYVRDVTGQDVVRCAQCERWQYNAPRTETGRRKRSVQTVHAAIKPKLRASVLSRAGAKCEVCGARGRLHVGHIVSVDAGLRAGLTEADLNHPENLLALCEECNLGWGAEPMPLPLAVAVLRARHSWVEAQRRKAGDDAA